MATKISLATNTKPDGSEGQALLVYNGAPAWSSSLITGWTTLAGTYAYVSASTFTIVGDYTTVFTTGVKLMLNNTTTKYFYVLSSTYSAPNTTVTVTGGSDYSLANLAVTAVNISHLTAPSGFPDWFNYAPALAGWSSAPATAVYKFRIDGRKVMVVVKQAGAATSDQLYLIIPAPVTAATVTSATWGACCWAATDSGTAVTAPARAYIGSAGTNITCTKDLTGVTNSWTASGTKLVNFQLEYEI
jgi:hypothetical protein